MVKKKIRVAIFSDPSKGSADKAVERFCKFSAGKVEIAAQYNVNKCELETLQGCDYAVVFGGDGSIISAARFLCDSNVPVIGVNLGKLGYLAEYNIYELEVFFDKVFSGKVAIEKRMILRCGIENNGKVVFESRAVNEVFITAGAPYQMIELQIKVDGESLTGCISDGLIISTPTGSTAYNLSAGGPILSGSMEAIVITAMCPHSLSFRPIVISAESTVEVIGLSVNKGTTVSADGQISQRLKKGEKVVIRREKGSFLVVNNPIRTQWDTLAAKLGWAEKPKYKNT